MRPVTAATAQKRAQHYAEQLKTAGVRMTRQRMAILEVLAETDDHPDAADIFARAVTKDASLSMSTVYRTMRVLERSGAIHRHAFADGRSRFEHADREHHDHLIDIETGQVIEFRSEKIERLQAEIAAELGYELVGHRLELYGTKRADGGNDRDS